jgi:hypothetical protein
MPKVTFESGPGQVQSCELIAGRTCRIGRDPTNDLVLADAKVSRVHAEIVFENGFFVLYDLDSANGSWVNGRKVRVAPLIDGAELRLGNSTGRAHLDAGPEGGSTVAASLDQLDSALPGMIDPPLARPRRRSEPAFPAGSRRLDATSIGASAASLPPSERPDLPAEPDRPQPRHSGEEHPAPRPRAPFEQNELFRFDEIVPGLRISSIRDAEGEPIGWFRRGGDLTVVIAMLVIAMITISGLAATAWLIYENRLFPAVLAAVITLGFAMIAVALIPRQSIAVTSDREGKQVLLWILQESRGRWPLARHSVHDESGETVAMLRRRGSRWRLFDALERPLAEIRRRGRRRFDVTAGLRLLASIAPSFDGRRQMVLDLQPDNERRLDRRTAVAAAIVVLIAEK